MCNTGSVAPGPGSGNGSSNSSVQHVVHHHYVHSTAHAAAHQPGDANSQPALLRIAEQDAVSSDSRQFSLLPAQPNGLDGEAASDAHMPHVQPVAPFSGIAPAGSLYSAELQAEHAIAGSSVEAAGTSQAAAGAAGPAPYAGQSGDEKHHSALNIILFWRDCVHQQWPDGPASDAQAQELEQSREGLPHGLLTLSQLSFSGDKGYATIPLDRATDVILGEELRGRARLRSHGHKDHRTKERSRGTRTDSILFKAFFQCQHSGKPRSTGVCAYV